MSVPRRSTFLRARLLHAIDLFANVPLVRKPTAGGSTPPRSHTRRGSVQLHRQRAEAIRPTLPVAARPTTARPPRARGHAPGPRLSTAGGLYRTPHYDSPWPRPRAGGSRARYSNRFPTTRTSSRPTTKPRRDLFPGPSGSGVHTRPPAGTGEPPRDAGSRRLDEQSQLRQLDGCWYGLRLEDEA